jgi:UDP-N-acetylglucosamine 2-epimerase
VKIAILTSSRADFGIYIPLIIALKKEKSISFNIIAFGTHVSLKYGNTITEIQILEKLQLYFLNFGNKINMITYLHLVIDTKCLQQ